MAFSEPRLFQDWPYQSLAPTEIKAPTVLVYAPTAWNGRSLTAWGFLANSEATAHAGITVAHFKTLLQLEQGNPAIGTQEQPVEQAITDYLGCLHSCIQAYFTPTQLGKAWHKAIVEFRLSIPAGWGADTVHRFKELAASAGFETPDGNHTIGTLLTESAAASIHAVKEGSSGIQVSADIVLRAAGPFAHPIH